MFTVNKFHFLNKIFFGKFSVFTLLDVKLDLIDKSCLVYSLNPLRITLDYFLPRLQIL